MMQARITLIQSLMPSGWFVYSAASETFSLTLVVNDDGDDASIGIARAWDAEMV